MGEAAKAKDVNPGGWSDMPESMMGKIDQVRTELSGKVQAIEASLDQKHSANRRDIHELRNGHQAILLTQEAIKSDVRAIKMKVDETLGNGRPGKIDKILEKVENIEGRVETIETNQMIRAALEVQATKIAGDATALDASNWEKTLKRWGLYLGLAGVLGPILTVLALHYLGWK